MPKLDQQPPPGASLLACAGDILVFSLHTPGGQAGSAFLRTNLGHADRRREEIVAHTESNRPFLAADWHDIPMTPTAPGHFEVRVPVLQPGWFAAKTCFLPAGSQAPEWPEGENTRIKVIPAATACANTLYTAFVRQFTGDGRGTAPGHLQGAVDQLDQAGYAVIPPSGTFRNLIRQLDFIIGHLGFRIIQLLPIHPAPTTYARMGRYGSPFASGDYCTVDPALAEFDTRATPLDQFRELADAVHARQARLLIDLPANHTGWASTFHTHHPEWFVRNPDGSFKSPGAWGTIWADLVELDYRHPALRAAMADVFLFWCRQGVDGFRCDAGYMIPSDTWRYIVARVRQSYPQTLFLLEGLGGKLETTDTLLTEANLDWAYSELFQTEDRWALERYLPEAIARSQRLGPLIHFAETHDNNRLAARGAGYARMRTALAALLSHSGAFGITNGVEWLATEKIDVHGAASLNWGAAEHQIDAIRRLNRLLARHPAFTFDATVELVQSGVGNVLVARRRDARGHALLVLVNLDANRAQTAEWSGEAGTSSHTWDLLTGQEVRLHRHGTHTTFDLHPGEVRCLTDDTDDLALLHDEATGGFTEPESIRLRRRNLLAMHLYCQITGRDSLPARLEPNDLGESFSRDPHAYCAFCADAATGRRPSEGNRMLPPVITWQWPQDVRRVVILPPGFLLLVRADAPFRVALEQDNRVLRSAESLALADGTQGTVLMPAERLTGALTLNLTRFGPSGAQHATANVHALEPADAVRVNLKIDAARIRANEDYALLTNGRGAMAQIRAAWGTLRSQYDALLAVNPNVRVPDNRRVFFTRCRAWVRYRGYSYALDATCAESFQADPGGTQAIWCFNTPVGMGRRTAITLTASLDRGRNRLRLYIQRGRLPARDTTALDNGTPITVILRPDIEARDFHTKTHADAACEARFSAALTPFPDGFTFRPQPGESYRMAVQPGAFQHDPAWSYGVPHPVEAERGLGPQTDLFSPGWFSIDLAGGETAILTAATEDDFELPPPHARPAPAPASNLPFAETLERALDTFVVRRDSRNTVIAGYPWFLDWGRDTLIALRGLTAAGRALDALGILCEFGRLEVDGTLPNMIRGEDHGNRETSDAPFWFMVAAGDIIHACGARMVLRALCGQRPLRAVLASIVEHTLAGTPNGIRVDPNTGLVFSPSHFTWMDTNYPAATPRQGYPIDIQALWIAGLTMMRECLRDNRFVEIEGRARASLLRRYVQPGGWLADSLRAVPGQSAASAIPEDALRPNQLLAVTLAAIPPADDIAQGVVRACEQLLVPGAIRSLADRPVQEAQPVEGSGGLLNDPHHPYWGHYRGDEDTRRKPAYHNGTAWGWPFPLYCEALLQVYGPRAKAPARALLASARTLLETGCLGNLPEIVDGDAPHRQRGCGAQAWSVSELLRVWKMVER